MSIRTHNVGAIPPDFEDFKMGFFIEAPPFYTGIRVKMTFSGERSKTEGSITTTETLSCENEKTFTRIPMFRDSDVAGIDEFALSEYDKEMQAISFLTPTDFDECRIVVPLWSKGDGLFIIPRSPQIGKCPVEIYYETVFSINTDVCGSWSVVDTDDPSNDASGDILIGSHGWPAFFFVVDPETDPDELFRTAASRWEVAPQRPPYHSLEPDGIDDTNFVDVSGWDIQQWRSKLGVNNVSYGEIHTDTGVTSDILVEIEWELLD